MQLAIKHSVWLRCDLKVPCVKKHIESIHIDLEERESGD